MNVSALKKELEKCRDDCEVIIFVKSESENNRFQYRPFRNIVISMMNEGSIHEEIHFDISVNTEYKNIHFPNNLTEEEVILLKDKRKMILEELDEIEKQLNEFKDFGGK